MDSDRGRLVSYLSALCITSFLFFPFLLFIIKMIKKKNSYLDAVVASGDFSVLNFDVGGRMSELAFGIRSGAFVPLKFPANFQLQPPGIFSVDEIVHVDHCHGRLLRWRGKGRRGGPHRKQYNRGL